jgi:hypothetical protein
MREDIIQKINSPYGLSQEEKLAVIHEGIGDINDSLSTSRVNQRKIIPFELYMRLEEEIGLGRETDDQFKQGLEHIHNKMLFDTFNEALDYFRPFGLKGCPFSWRPNAGRMKAIEYGQDKLPEILERAQERVLDWGMFVCGFIPDKEDSLLGEIAIEEDYLNQIKEERLVKMLTCEVSFLSNRPMRLMNAGLFMMTKRSRLKQKWLNSYLIIY